MRHAIDLLEQFGVLLEEPHTRRLSGKLRELRAGPWRVTYFADPRRRMVLLTSFRKTGRRTEPAEILKARTSAGLTQRELAARIGSSQPTVARWESGAQLPSVRSLTRIAEATGFHLTVGLRRGEAPGRAFLNVGVQG